jgi:hypothetical protein
MATSLAQLSTAGSYSWWPSSSSNYASTNDNKRGRTHLRTGPFFFSEHPRKNLSRKLKSEHKLTQSYSERRPAFLLASDTRSVFDLAWIRLPVSVISRSVGFDFFSPLTKYSPAGVTQSSLTLISTYVQ